MVTFITLSGSMVPESQYFREKPVNRGDTMKHVGGGERRRNRKITAQIRRAIKNGFTYYARTVCGRPRRIPSEVTAPANPAPVAKVAEEDNSYLQIKLADNRVGAELYSWELLRMSAAGINTLGDLYAVGFSGFLATPNLEKGTILKIGGWLRVNRYPMIPEMGNGLRLEFTKFSVTPVTSLPLRQMTMNSFERASIRTLGEVYRLGFSGLKHVLGRHGFGAKRKEDIIQALQNIGAPPLNEMGHNEDWAPKGG